MKKRIKTITVAGKSVLFASIITILLFSRVSAAKPVTYNKNSASRLYRAMARAYMAYGQFNKAMPLAEKALSLAKTQNACDEELAGCLGDLSYIYLNIDRFSEAETLCKRSIELQKNFYYDRHPYVAYSLRNLASIYVGQGKFVDANDCLQQAFNIMLDSHPADDAVFAPFDVDYAKLLTAQGNLAQAEAYYDKALNLINQTFGPDHLYTATVLANLADLYTLQCRYELAEPLINKSQAIQEKFYGSDNHLVAGAWLTKAKICQAKGFSAEADSLIEKARLSIQKTGNDKALAKLELQIDAIRQTNGGQVRQIKADTSPSTSLGASQPVVRLFNSST